MIVDRIFNGETENIEWAKVWKLAKMAFEYSAKDENKL